MDVKGPNSYKQQNLCCALCTFSFSCDTPDAEIDWHLDKLKRESKQVWNRSNRDSGEKCALVVCVMPAEKSLKARLEQRGFVKILDFERRTGYSKDNHLELMSLKV